MAPSSVVQTGVKSLGWENKIAQPSPIHSWKRIVPCVVSAVKSGAVSLMRGIADVAGVNVAVLISGLLLKIEVLQVNPDSMDLAPSEASRVRKRKTHPRYAGVGPEASGYPHASVSKQQQQHGIGFRIAIGYARRNTASTWDAWNSQLA